MAESPIGKSVTRLDGRLKVTGAAKYAADYQVDRLAHGYLLLSTVGRGTVRSADASAATSSPGVLAVYTPFNPLKLNRVSGAGPNWVPLQDNQIRHYGQIVGLVVAETFEQARDAAALVKFAYDARTPAASFEAGLPNATSAPAGFGEPASFDLLANGVTSIDQALSASQVRVSAEYRQPLKHHSAMEPHAAVAVWRDGVLTAYSGTQSPTSHAKSIATALGLSAANVHVISEHVGGGFGNKATSWTHDYVTAAAARALNRPVKTVLTREQTFSVTGHRSTVAQTVALGANQDGTLTAVKHDATSSASGSGWWYETGPGTTTRFLYKTSNLHVGQKIVTLDIPPCTVMRAPGEESGSFALESAMDELAVALKMDPVALRTKNYATVYPGRNVPWSSKHLDECYRVGAEKFGWSRRNPTPRAVTDGDWLVGMGMGTAVYPAQRMTTSVKVRFQPDGKATVATASADIGTGMWTVLTALGADALGLPMDRISAAIGDSALPSNTGAYGSSSTASVSSALRAAATAAIQALIMLAVQNSKSPFFGMSASQVTYREGVLTAGNRRVAFADLLTATGSPGVEASGADNGGDPNRYAFHSFGAQFCELRVHQLTGEVRLTKITTALDVGRIVNKLTARSQVMGAVTFGIGHALSEGSFVESANGRLANANFADYLLPVNADVPPIDVHFVEYPDTVFNPVGVRGLGEIGVVGVAAAIANAVYNATGIRVRNLPITLDKLVG